MGFIDADQLARLAEPLRKSGYGQYLLQVLAGAGSPMKFTPTRLPDVLVVEPAVFGDERGFLMETWQPAKLPRSGDRSAIRAGQPQPLGQGTLRGLHYQLGRPQGKLVRVVAGRSSTSLSTCGGPRPHSVAGLGRSSPRVTTGSSGSRRALPMASTS